MDTNTILEKLNCKTAISQTYEVFSDDENSCFFGKDSENNIIFMIPSNMPRLAPCYQETKSLRFAFNKKCTFRSDTDVKTQVVHLLTCKETDNEKIVAFIRLTKAFSQGKRDNDQLYLSKLFSSISALFDRKKQISEIELQGLFSELYVILHFYKADCDISKYWQSKNMMKFDFSISENKRIEIKSTLKPNREYHFKHDQLLSELYDIRIVSVMLQKNDYGVSLGDLIEQIRDIYANNFALLIHIESMVSQIDNEELYRIKYDSVYIKKNLRYYNAKDIPHFNEKTPDGVFNAEYDCSLDTSPTVSEENMLSWIKETSYEKSYIN